MSQSKETERKSGTDSIRLSQTELASIFSERPQNFAWFLGAGASRTAGLPTASDIIWDLKRRYYCREENQDFSRQDILNEAVKVRIQSFLDSRGFPEPWSEDEYATYFEKIFGDDRERQRRYLKAILSEEGVTLSVGNRIFGAFMAVGFSRVAFTTNFDSVVEKAVAEMGAQSLSAYHLEGAHAANNALNNEEYPLYCKLHGDFRYESLKNLPQDLAQQNEEFSRCLINTGNRFGFIVTGYSGRDESVMELFHQVLESSNPFPHGLYWTGMKGSKVHPAVSDLIRQAQDKSVSSEYVEIETFDALMLRLWRNSEGKPPELDAKVKKSSFTSVDIPLPRSGSNKPLLRVNALPLLSTPAQCLTLSFETPKEWDELQQVSRESRRELIFSKSDTVWCWGTEKKAREMFGGELASISVRDIPDNIRMAESLHVKRFIEEALCLALSRKKPLLTRTRRSSTHLIVGSRPDDVSSLDPLRRIVGQTSGIVPDLFTSETSDYPQAEQVRWSEALRISVEQKNGQLWMVIDPDIWIWPPRAREDAKEFLRERRADRLNAKYNDLLGAWVHIILGTDERNISITVSAFKDGNGVENPSFCFGSRTAFSRKLSS